MYTNVRFIFQFVFNMHVVYLTDFSYVMHKQTVKFALQYKLRHLKAWVCLMCKNNYSVWRKLMGGIKMSVLHIHLIKFNVVYFTRAGARWYIGRSVSFWVIAVTLICVSCTISSHTHNCNLIEVYLGGLVH